METAVGVAQIVTALVAIASLQVVWRQSRAALDSAEAIARRSRIREIRARSFCQWP